MALFFDEMVAQLGGQDCRLIANVASELAAAQVHVRPSQLERAHGCVVDAAAGETRVRLARAFLELQEPGERAGQARRLLREVDDLAVRIEAFHALVRLGARALPELTALAQDPDPQLREYALQSLHRLGEISPIDVLVRGLTDADFAARWTAADALIDLGPRALLPVLRAVATYPPSRTFHDAARRVLARLPVPAEAEAGMAALAASLRRHTSIYESGALALDLLRQFTERGAPIDSVMSGKETLAAARPRVRA